MSPVRIRIWLKNGEFLQTSIDIDDLIAINIAYGKVKAGVVRNENLKITISNITFHVDDIKKHQTGMVTYLQMNHYQQ